MNLFAGIDPGLGGAVGLVDGSGGFVAVFDMPTIAQTRTRRAVDAAGLAALLREYRPAFVLVERVGPRPGEGAVGAFSFGQGSGIIIGTLAALGIAYDLVQPMQWKKRCGIGPGSHKDASIAAAMRLLPEAAPHLSRKKDHGRAESLLLALLARDRRR